jgi:DNA-binding transcriptional MerR regulator
MSTLAGKSLYGSSELCRIIGISYRQLEYWTLIGVIIPTVEHRGAKSFKRYTDNDIWILKRIKELTDEGFLVSRALDKLKKEHPERFARAGRESLEKGL